MTNLGGFSEEALALYQLSASEQSYEFSEGDTYDFARCVRPDGSAYGTSGTCRKGSPSDAKPKKPGGSSDRETRKRALMGHLQKRYDQLDKQDKELNKVLAKAKTPTQLLKEGSQNNPAVQRRNREQAKRDADTQRMYDRANERAKKDIQEIKDEIKNRGPHTKEERAKLDQMLARAQARLNQKPMTREQFQAGLRKMKP